MWQRVVKLVLILFLSLTNPAFINAELPEEYEGVYLLIDKKTNRLHVFLNGYIVYTFPVGTGKQKYQTPTGTFKIITKVYEPWYIPKNIPGNHPSNPLGTRWLGLDVPNTGGYKYGIHGTNNPHSIGHYVSQGCIRMHNKDVEFLYEHLPLNTIVIIKD